MHASSFSLYLHHSTSSFELQYSSDANLVSSSLSVRHSYPYSRHPRRTHRLPIELSNRSGDLALFVVIDEPWCLHPRHPAERCPQAHPRISEMESESNGGRLNPLLTSLAEIRDAVERDAPEVRWT
jgi:hypothetical protein